MRLAPNCNLSGVHALYQVESEPLDIYDEMDWIANRCRLELRYAIDQLVRQERDELVMKLNQVVHEYTRNGVPMGTQTHANATTTRKEESA